MRCPHCGALDTQVRDSRPSEDHTAIRRRRSCPDCGARFTTFERVQLRELTIVKRDGRRVPFDRDKLTRSIGVALRKRPVSQERIEQLVSSIVRALENRNDAEISSQDVGSLVMEGLKALDGVAYIRYASVYRDFREAKDFQRVLGELGDAFPRAAEETMMQFPSVICERHYPSPCPSAPHGERAASKNARSASSVQASLSPIGRSDRMRRCCA